MAEYETIKDYLVALGFKVDEHSFDRFLRTMAKGDSAFASFAKAGAVVVSTLAAITTATVAMLDKVSQADLDYQKFALRMFMTTDAAKKLKIATDALGESFEDIAWVPELRERYFSLLRQQEGMEEAGDFKERMKDLRDIKFEFTRMKVEGVYALQWIGYHLAKNLLGPANSLPEALDRINDAISQKMPEWTEKAATCIGMVIDLVKSLIRFLWDMKWPLMAIAAYFALSSPLGLAITTISTLIALIDDFYAYIDGRKSSQTLAPIWEKIIWAIEKTAKAATIAYVGMIRVFDLARGNRSFKEVTQEIADIWNAPDNFVQKKLARPAPRVSPQAFGGDIDTLRRIIMAESSGVSTAHNPGGGGTGAFGLLQIRGTLHERDLIKAGIINSRNDLFDPQKNLAAGAWLYEKYGWTPWNASRARWDRPNADRYMGDINVGGVTVHVTNPGASADDVYKETLQGVEDALAAARTRWIRENTGIY